MMRLMFAKRPRLILAAAMVTALCLACIRLGDRAIWLDEATSFRQAHWAIPAILVQQDNAPLHYLILWVWLKFGDSEFWFRLSSALCFVLTVPVVYVMGRTLHGRRAGLYAAWLAATAPFLIRYAQQGRMYALLTLLCSLALLSVALIISRHPDRRPPVIGAGLWGRWRQSGRPLSAQGWRDDLLWGLYIATALGSMLTHHAAVLLPVATTLIFLAAIVVAPRFRWRRLWNLIIANAAVLALYVVLGLPSALGFYNRFIHVPPSKLGFWRIRLTVFTVYANEHLYEQIIVMAALALIALWGWRRRKDWRWLAFALIGSTAVTLILAAANIIFSWGIFFPRTIIWAAVPFIVACAVGIARLPWASLRRLILAGLLLCNLYGVLNAHLVLEPWMGERYEPWHQVAQIVAEAVPNDGAVLLCPVYLHMPFNYYWRRHPRELITVFAWREMTAYRFLTSAHDQVARWRRRDGPHDLVSLLDDYSELWLVTFSNQNICDLPALRGVLAERGRLIDERDFGRIKLLGWTRAD